MLNTAAQKIQAKNHHPIIGASFRILAVIIGALLAAAGLELFLIPNNFLDGGVVGIAIILTKFFPIPVGVFIALINIPFLFVAYKHSGWASTIKTAIGVATLSFATVWFHHFDAVTDNFLLALAFGGVLVGAGVGLALRYGGALDGTEILSVFIANRTKFTVDQLILAINAVIFTVAGFLIGVEEALASFLLFYMVITTVITKVMQGGTEIRMVQIMSINHEAVAEAVHKVLNRKVVFLNAHDDNPETDLKMVLAYCARYEESRLLEAISEVDSKATVVVLEAANVHGSVFSGNKHH